MALPHFVWSRRAEQPESRRKGPTRPTQVAHRSSAGQQPYLTTQSAEDPHNRGKNLTVVGAVSATAGLVAWRALDGGMDGAAFLSVVTEALIPALRPGQTVVMDNLSSHKTRAVQDAFASAGIGVLYLPRYSPEYNPIELCWAAVKRVLRGVAARTRERLRDAVAATLACVTAGQAKRWVRHCGYWLTTKSD